MNTSTTMSSTVSVDVNTIGLIIGISVVGAILLTVAIVALIICIRNRLKKKKLDRSRIYMVPDGASPYSSMNGPPSNGAIPSFNTNGYDNKGFFHAGEFRPNPLAENPYYQPHNPMKQGVSMISLPPTFSEVNQPRLTASTPSLNYEPGAPRGQGGSDRHALFKRLYEHLTDTIHESQGRPLYLCKRANYPNLSNYFDIVGKSRDGDWLVRPRPNVPNRPKKGSKKKQAPKPEAARKNNSYDNKFSSDINGGFMLRRPGSGVITTPFGAAERVPSRYLSGSQLDRMQPEGSLYPQYTSLPRDGQLRQSDLVKQQNNELDEKLYAKVVKKHNIDGSQSPVIVDRKNPTRRAFNTIEESPQQEQRSNNNHNHRQQHNYRKEERKSASNTKQEGHRERSGSTSTLKSLGITDHFRFLDQYETEEERF